MSLDPPRTGPARLFAVFCAIWAVLVLYSYPSYCIRRYGADLEPFPSAPAVDGRVRPTLDEISKRLEEQQAQINQVLASWSARSNSSRWLMVVRSNAYAPVHVARGLYMLLALFGVPAVVYWVWRGFSGP